MGYFKDGMKRRIYFDSFGQTTLAEIRKHLKTKKEYETGKAVVQRNTDIVQHVNTHVCGHLYNRREDNDVEVKPKFKIGDRVRILKKKKTFEKGFPPNWADELFIVSGVRLTKPVTYNIKDLKGETIKGSFYRQVLQKASQEVYRIDKVLRKRK